MMMRWLMSFFCLLGLNVEAVMHHCEDFRGEWREENVAPFDELMLSWNSPRPKQGQYQIYVSVQMGDWSPWLLYATWGSEGQMSYLNTLSEMPVRAYQDAIEVMEGKKATGFRVKIEGEIDPTTSLHVYTNGDRAPEPQSMLAGAASIHLPVGGISQMALNHVRNKDLCSPTSTTAVVRYLSNDFCIDPCQFALRSWDSGFDIFGHWVFNVAQAAAELGPSWKAWVERLSGFEAIYRHLQQGAPVVVSVRGPLAGSAAPYAKGHLMAVIGYDADHQKVLCMDPAFPADDQTHAQYDLQDFVQAWNRRGRVAYVFVPSGRE